MGFHVCTPEYWVKKKQSLPAELVRGLIREAESYLPLEPLAVTQKKKKPLFGDVHDTPVSPSIRSPIPETQTDRGFTATAVSIRILKFAISSAGWLSAGV